MIIAAAPLVLAVAACGSFVFRKRLALVAMLTFLDVNGYRVETAATGCNQLLVTQAPTRQAGSWPPGDA